MNTTQLLVQYMWNEAYKNNYRKLEDAIYEEQIYPVEIQDNSGQVRKVNLFGNAYKMKCSVEEFLYEITADHINPEMHANRIREPQVLKNIVKEFIENEDYRCPKLKLDELEKERYNN